MVARITRSKAKIGTHNFVRQYLHSKNRKLFIGNKQILQYTGKPNYPLTPITDTLTILPDAPQTKEPLVQPLDRYAQLQSLGYSVISKSLRKSEIVSKSGQRVMYLLMPTKRADKPKIGWPYGHKAEYDLANKRLRLLGPNAGPRGTGPWIATERQKRNRSASTEFDVDDFVNTPHAVFGMVQRGILKEPEDPIYKEIPEIPVIQTDAGELICIPQTLDEPSIGICGQKRPLHSSNTVMVEGRRVRIGDIAADFQSYIGKEVWSIDPATWTVAGDRITELVDAGECDALHFKTRTGKRITCSTDHTFITPKGVVEAKDLAVKDKLPLTQSIPDSFPPSPAIEMFSQNEKGGYFLGMYLAEGNISRETMITITNGTKEILDFVHSNYPYGIPNKHRYVKKDCNCSALSVSNRPLAEFILSTAGTGSGKKQVPAFVFSMCEEFRSGVLSGYFDGDGCFTNNSNSHKTTFCSKSKALRDGISLLLAGFGIVANHSINEKKSGKYKGNKYFWGHVRNEDMKVLGKVLNLKSPKKRELLESFAIQDCSEYRQSDLHEKIVDVVKDGEVRAGEIERKLGINHQTLNSELELLVQLGVLRRKIVNKKNGKTRPVRAKILSANSEFEGIIKGDLQVEIIKLLNEQNRPVSEFTSLLKSDWRNVYRAVKRLKEVGAVSVRLVDDFTRVPVTADNTMYSLRDVKKKIGQVFWDEIESISPAPKSHMYCLVTEKNHNFMLYNGLFTHNSGKTWLMHGIADRAFHKAGWDKRIAFLNDKLLDTETYSLPSSDSVADELDILLGEEVRPLPMVHLSPTVDTLDGTDIKIVHPEENGFAISLPYKELIAKFDTYFALDKSDSYFSEMRPALQKCESIQAVIDTIDSAENVHTNTKNKIRAAVKKFFDAKILDLTTGIPSMWTVKTPTLEGTYNPLTACLLAGVVPSLYTEQLLPKEYYPQYFKYLVEDLFRRQSVDQYFVSNQLQIWLFIDEVLDVCSREVRTAATQILKECVTQGGPKRIGTFLATQNFMKIEERVRTNIKYLFTFTNPGEASMIQSQYNIPAFWADEIKNLNKFECVAITTEEFVIYDSQGRKTRGKGPFKGKAIPPLSLHRAPRDMTEVEVG